MLAKKIIEDRLLLLLTREALNVEVDDKTSSPKVVTWVTISCHTNLDFNYSFDVGTVRDKAWIIIISFAS